jgi:integrase
MTSSMGRPRKNGRIDLPTGLLQRTRTVAGKVVTYWYWRDPRDGLEKPLQCPNDRETAIQRATQLNAIIARQNASKIVSDIIAEPKQQRKGIPFDAWAHTYMSKCEQRGLAYNTLKSKRSLLKTATAHFCNTPIHELSEDVAAIAGFLESITKSGRPRLAQAMRSMLVDIFTEAHHSGALDAKLPNPAALTRGISVDVKRARLTLDEFKIILPHCQKISEKLGAWHINSVMLALVTAQRREDLAKIQWKRGRDWDALWSAFQRKEKGADVPYPFIEDGLLWIVQGKTGALVKIPLTLRLDALNISVGEVIAQCRSNVATRYLLHHTKPFGNAPAGSQAHINTMSRQFAAARDASGLTWQNKTPPTFHELRSLSERLYKAQGINTQTLLGHKSAKMTAIYDNPRGAEWALVSVGNGIAFGNITE